MPDEVALTPSGEVRRTAAGEIFATPSTAAPPGPSPDQVYIDQILGLDTNPGTQAAPWKTLAKFNASGGAATSAFFKRGCVWRENLIVTKSPMTYGSYGSGANPVISGSDVISSWTLSGSNYFAVVGLPVHDCWFGETRGRYRSSVANLASTNDWFWDSATSRLYVRTSGAPSNVQASVRPRPIDSLGFDDNGLNFDGLDQHGMDWRIPFGSTSAWNAAPGSARTSAGAVPGFAVGMTSWENNGEWSAPFYFAKTTDPLVDVRYLDSWAQVWNTGTTGWKRSGNTAPIEATMLSQSVASFPSPSNVYSSQSTTSWVLPQGYDALINPVPVPKQIRCPTGAIPAGAADGHFVVIQPDGRVFESFTTIRLSSGTILAQRYQIMEPWRQADWWTNGLTASMVPIYAGLIKSHEVTAGSINHALQLKVGAQTLATSWVYPAAAFDRDATTNGTPYSGTLPLGTKLALPTTTIVNNVASTVLGRMIGNALKNYGAIIVDRGGSNGCTIGVESNATETSLTTFNQSVSNDLHALFDLVQRATGSAPVSTYQRPYGDAAAWNVLASGVGVNPSSASLATNLHGQSTSTGTGWPTLTFSDYTYAVRKVSEATDNYTFTSTNPTWGNISNGALIPWNPTWNAQGGTDRQTILLNTATGEERNFWEVVINHGAKTITVGSGQLVPGSYWTKIDGYPPPRGVGIQTFAMLVVPEEIADGVIRHALSMPIPTPSSTTYYNPATKLERTGPPASPTGIPEGMRFSLNLTNAQIDAWSNSLPAGIGATAMLAAKIIVTAMRDYGWFVTDTAGSVHLQFEDRISAGTKWDAVGLGNLGTFSGKRWPDDMLSMGSPAIWTAANIVAYVEAP